MCRHPLNVNEFSWPSEEFYQQSCSLFCESSRSQFPEEELSSACLATKYRFVTVQFIPYNQSRLDCPGGHCQPTTLSDRTLKRS